MRWNTQRKALCPFHVLSLLSGTCFALLGYPKLLLALGIGISYGTSFPGWEYYTPPVFFTLLFVLSSVLSFAVGIMLAFHLHNISKGTTLLLSCFVADALDYLGEPSVEAQDFEVYQKWAGGRGEVRFFSAFIWLSF